MRLEIPILIQRQTDGPDHATVYTVRPLFFDQPYCSDRIVLKATTRLEEQLRDHLQKLARSGDHGALAACAFSPAVWLDWLELRLELRRGMFRGRFPLAVFRHADRKLAVSPYLLDVWFDVPDGASHADRAAEVFTRHFRSLEKISEDWQVQGLLEPFRTKHKPSLSVLDLVVATQARLPDPEASPLALLGGTGQMDGDSELHRVGQCLEHRFPDGLDRAIQRDGLAGELQALLATSDNRPVLLVGPPLVGKTNLIHEVVYRVTEQRRREQNVRHSDYDRRRHWLLAPQRLVTGMSFVGQWEERLLAILRHVRRRDHILVLDDLLGMYQAGLSAQSNLSAADVLKPYIERREIRLLAELTPQQLNVFRERDRGFADLFHLVHVQEPDQESTLRILLGVIRNLEARLGTRFALPVLPTVLDLAGRYQREAALPGSVARWLEHLAMKYPHREVTRREALEEFRAKSGLEVAFLDDEQPLSRQDVLTGLRQRIVGQSEAVEAMADVVSMAKARLHDPQRPLGSLLFLGPTGVGKTECAKALAEYLFGDDSRLIRFDMNEFVSADAAARLAGTFDQPEGLLTSAVRQQPFCVLLFDELEKAHPDVFDLLLQVLGEARLTDALGRTTDFSNAVVILTSNLGTRQAAADLGFARAPQTETPVYLKAVQAFFRPEFFNRLDRILPFQRLNREELGQIARSIIRGILARAGLAQRKCTVDLTGDAIQWIVQRGYDPVLGARAMRRAVETELVRPVARQLAAILPETPTVIRVFRRREQLVADVTPLVEAEPLPESARPEHWEDLDECLARIRRVHARIEQACRSWRPADGISVNNPSPLLAWYLGLIAGLKDQRDQLQYLSDYLRGADELDLAPVLRPKQPRRRSRYSHTWRLKERRILKELYAAQDVLDCIKEFKAASLQIHRTSTREAEVTSQLMACLDRLALWDALQPGERGWEWQRVLVLVRGVDDEETLRARLAHRIACQLTFEAGMDRDDEFFEEHVEISFGMDAQRWTPTDSPDHDASGASRQDPRPGWLDWIADPELRADYQTRHRLDVMHVEGHRAERLLRLMEGTHLFVRSDGQLQPLQVIVLPMAQDQTPPQRLILCLAQHDRYQQAMARGETPPAPDPFAWQPVVTLDPGRDAPDIWFRSSMGRSSLRALLPLPPEFRLHDAGHIRPSGDVPP
jgi:ATP-dependent Clp protease ATP-binding subunit ClpC